MFGLRTGGKQTGRAKARPKARLVCERLEARDVPAAVYWVSTGSSDAENPANWSSGGHPGYADDIYFDGAMSNANCDGLSGSPTVPWHSIHLVNGYTGHFAARHYAISVGDLELASGNFDQPPGSYADPYNSSTVGVFGTFTWTGGVLNSTDNRSALVMLPGSHAEIGDPTGAGRSPALTLGSDLIFDSGDPDDTPTSPPPPVPTSPPPPTGGPGGGSDQTGTVGTGERPAGPGNPGGGKGPVAPGNPTPGLPGATGNIHGSVPGVAATVLQLTNGASFFIGTNAAPPAPPANQPAKAKLETDDSVTYTVVMLGHQNPQSAFNVGPSGKFRLVSPGGPAAYTNSDLPLNISGGTVTIETGVTATFNKAFVIAPGSPPGTIAANVSMGSGELFIRGGSKLVAPSLVLVTGGLLATLTGANQTATITTPLLTVAGASVNINYDNPNVLGVLSCSAAVNWTSGTYYVDVNAAAKTSDLWQAGGKFTIGTDAKVVVGCIGGVLPGNTDTFGIVKAPTIVTPDPAPIGATGVAGEAWVAFSPPPKDTLYVKRS